MDQMIALEQAAEEISKADVLFISAGAGMGVDSGLPDFRGNKGFWKAYPLLKEENISFQDLANPAWFEQAPQRAWGFYGHRFNLYRNTEPHKGFELLKKWGMSKKLHPFVFTSNVDGHFQKSGFHPDWIYECHGSINYHQCVDICCDDIWNAQDNDLDVDVGKLVANGQLPKCLNCGEIARPNILMFGDATWISARASRQRKNFENWKRKNEKNKIVTVEIGAGKDIPTARYASDSMAGYTIRINPRDADGNMNTISIGLGALEALSHIDKALSKL